MNLAAMFKGKEFSPKTTTTAQVSASATVIPLAAVSVLPPAPNICTLGDEDLAEIVYYSALNASGISACVRGYAGTTARVWNAATLCFRAFSAEDHRTLVDNITTLNAMIPADLGAATAAQGALADTSLQNVVYTTAGTANAYTLTIPGVTAYAQLVNKRVLVRFHLASTSQTVNINTNGLGNVRVYFSGTQTLPSASYLAQNCYKELMHNGSAWEIVGGALDQQRTLYTRAHLKPPTPTGEAPTGWNANPDLLNTLTSGTIPNTVPGNLYGTLWQSNYIVSTALWSEPFATEPYDSNPYARFPFTVGDGDMTAIVGGVTRTVHLQSASSTNTRLIGTTPYGTPGIIWKGTVPEAGDASYCGGLSNNTVAQTVPTDPTKLTRYSAWIMRDAGTVGDIYCGPTPSGITSLESYVVGSGWTPTSAAAAISAARTLVAPTAGVWYLAVWYLLPQNADPILSMDAGVGTYSRATGKRVYAPASTVYLQRRTVGNAVSGIRVTQRNVPAPHNNETLWIFDPRVEVCDGREPTIQQLLGTEGLASEAAYGASQNAVYTTAGSANAYTVTIPNVTADADLIGKTYILQFHAAATSATVNINFNGLGDKRLYLYGTTTLPSATYIATGQRLQISVSSATACVDVDAKTVASIGAATAAQGAKADSALQSFTETDPTVSAWAKAATKPSYTASEVGAATAAQGAKADSALQSFTETDPTVSAWAKAATKPSYTASEVGAAVPSTSTTATITVANWVGSAAPYTRTHTVAGVTATNNIIVSAATASIADWESAKIYATAQGAGTVTFTAYGTKPTASIVANVVILG